MVVVDRLHALFETERAGRDTLSHIFHEAHTPLGKPLLASVSGVLNSTHCQHLHQLRTHSSSAHVAFPRPTPSATGSSSRAEPVVIGGGVLTLYCVGRFGLQYHRRPSDYEIAPALNEADIRGKEA